MKKHSQLRIALAFFSVLFLSLGGILNQVGAVEGEVVYEGTNTEIAGDDSHSKGPFPIGFTFTYYGTEYTEAYVNINGTIGFSSAFIAFTNQALSSSSAMANTIYAFWDDLMTKDYSDKTIYYKTIGDSGSRKFIMQWTGMYFFNTDIQMGTFQVILYEGTNEIQIQYRDLLGGDRALGNSATVGIKKDESTTLRQDRQGMLWNQEWESLDQSSS